MTHVDEELATRLVSAQFPQWAHLPVRAVEPQGWDNRTFRLGDGMKLRFPRAAAYSAQAEKEARWLPWLAPRLPAAIPAVLGLGAPQGAYAFRWTVQDWIAGDVAGAREAQATAFAEDVAAFLRALHVAEADEGPAAGAHSFHRGGGLAVYDAETRAAVIALGGAVDGARALSIWDEALAARWEGPTVWVHGDMAAGNLLVRDGRLLAVIDFGCMAVGDGACDLTLAWTLFQGQAREAFRSAVPVDDAMWSRAHGWALWKALITLAQTPGDQTAGRELRDVMTAS